ncbi:MAG: C4-dicarboxylate transporter DcuC [Bacteroidetes bacterium]|nr:C4-dicarboxylate transporter DcuC [Bacteroidota bacterium]MDA1224809.1 C4-dicarboxylate transporter DcuC [Bacteroidota bacterium]
MSLLISFIALAITIFLLYKKMPSVVILFSVGTLMILTAYMLESPIKLWPKSLILTTKSITDIFVKTNQNVGLMIMVIGGFIAYSKHIGASQALVDQATKPIQFLKNAPHLAAALMVPLGQLLFICIPSAAGLGMLLMMTIFPVLINLGVTKPTAVSAIALTTAIGVGPASALSASAANILNVPVVHYFTQYQWGLFWTTSLFMMIVFYFTNKHYDRKEIPQTIASAKESATESSSNAPKIYALLPVLPLLMLILFSGLIPGIPLITELNTTTALFMGFGLSVIFELIRLKDLRRVFSSVSIFWDGMSSIFKKVVILIIAAETFANGLISLGFIDSIVSLSQFFQGHTVGLILTIIIFVTSTLMGSGNAAFFAFGPLIPNIAKKLGIDAPSLLVQMNFSANLGRTISPISGILIALSEISGVDVNQIVKRNLFPIILSLFFMLIISAYTL